MLRLFNRLYLLKIFLAFIIEAFFKTTGNGKINLHSFPV